MAGKCCSDKKCCVGGNRHPNRKTLRSWTAGSFALSTVSTDGPALIIPNWVGSNSAEFANYRLSATLNRAVDSSVEPLRMTDGALYLPCEGDWRIKAEDPNYYAGGKLEGDILIYEVCSPEAAAMLLPGALMVTAESASAVGVASAYILVANSRRRYLYIQNDSANNVFVRANQPSALSSGWGLYGEGSDIEFDVRKGDKIPKGPIAAIASAAASNIHWVEGE